MARKNQSGPCAYCGAPSQTKDHVISRKLMSKEGRSSNKIVPSCHNCNSEKAKLELYLNSILPMFNKNSNNRDVIEMVKPRLDNNRKLAQALWEGLTRSYLFRDHRTFSERLIIDIDFTILRKYISMISKGVIYNSGAFEESWNNVVFLTEVDDVLINYMSETISKSENNGEFINEFLYSRWAMKNEDGRDFLCMILKVYNGMEMPQGRSLNGADIINTGWFVIIAGANDMQYVVDLSVLRFGYFIS